MAQRGPRHLRWLLLGWVLLLAPRVALAAPPTRVAQADVVNCTVRSMHGLQTPGGIDKRLTFLQKELKRPPFSAYRTIRLLAEKQLDVPQNATKEEKLPTGKILKLTFKEKLLERKDQLRLRLHLSITPPKQTKFLPGTLYTIADKGTLLVAGDSYQGGTLVVGITCQAK